MKLFHKFLIALIFISIVPLIIYGFVLLKTTGRTLKIVINQNTINLSETITKEVDKFFIELDALIDVARDIEKQQRLTVGEKAKILLGQFSNSQTFMSLFLVNKDFEIITGMSSEEGSEGMNLDKDLLQKADLSNQLEVGPIRKTSNGKPYIDIIYPLDTSPREYIFYKVRIGYLLSRINSLLYITDKKKTSKIVLLLDQYNSFVSVPAQAVKSLTEQEIQRLRELKLLNINLIKNLVVVPGKSRGPKWMIYLMEPSSSLYSSIIRLQISAVVIVISTFCFAIIGAYILARSLTKPIEALVSGIQIVADGNLEYRVPELSNDELSTLSKIFNDMTVKLKKYQEDMKRSERLSTIGQMANILGHEIRNPLAAISNATYLVKWQLLKMQGIEPKIFKHIGIIESEIKSTEKIINDMLDFSRSRPPVLAEKDMNELINNIIEEMKVPENIKINSLLGDVPKVKIDIEEVKQVIRNLINNAIDAMREKESGVLTIKTYISSIPSSHSISALAVDISDTGCGISAENLEKIFEPFFSTKSKGTGLGLAVVKRIIQERHKGSIEVQSKVGVGTTFIIKFPL